MHDHDDPIPLINPGSGLPMTDDCFDIAGNPFGCGDMSHPWQADPGWHWDSIGPSDLFSSDW